MGDDLIWVGNTLYPRMVVQNTSAIVVLVIIAIVVYLTRKW